MGYLSQKKQRKRESIFLFFMAVVMVFFTTKCFFNSAFHIAWFNLFHVYCLSGILVVYSLWRRRYKSAIFFACFFLINYTYIAASANIFISDKFNGKQNLVLFFNPDKPLFDQLKNEEIMSSGSVFLANRYKTPFVRIKKNIPLTIVRVDLPNTKEMQYSLIFKHLNEFIIKQDNPVIIFGNFGIPVWNRDFKKFLNESGLYVKNRLIFYDGVSCNIFSLPRFYVLGFKEMGISDISFMKENKQEIIKLDISFNPEAI